MSERLVLLPGWALGCSPLQPLVETLHAQAPWLDVQCHDYPPLTHSHLADWLDVLDATLPDNVWLGGWSLGGMLATALAARRGHRARGVVAMGVNASFVARPHWAQAMAHDTFRTFSDHFLHAPRETLKRFALMTAQGGHDTRRLGKQLVEALQHASLPQASASLALLGQLELHEAMATLSVPQLYLFGEFDMLVPAAARHAIAALLAANPGNGETYLLADTGHGFPLERSAKTATLIIDFIARHRHAPS